MRKLALHLGWAVCLTLAATVGCADGPVSEWAALNPWERRQWEEDEKFGPLLHQQIAELAALRRSAARMGPEQRQRNSNELGRLLREDSNPTLRAEVAQTLGAMRTPTAAAALRLALTDPDSDVRIAACAGWQDFGGPEGAQALAETLGSDTDLDVRLAAARSLESFSEPTAVQALGVALDDTDPALQYRAVQSLKSISGRDYGNDLNAWRQFAAGGNPSVPTPTLAERWNRWF